VVAGLLARRAADTGPITILPCDNLMQNGAAFRTVVEDGIEAVDPSLMDWASQNVDWATSMVDRITPATTDAERQAVADSQGWYDASPVRTEPFREWVIQGSFPSGRPQWEQAGVTLTDDVVPFEQRKLWMLNGSHSTLAYCGSVLGFETVADAIANPRLRKWVDEWWDLAGSYLSIPSDDYRRRLVERFSNPRIHHHLFQIASDGSQKLPVRIVPVAKKALAEGKSIVPPARTIGAWILFLRTFGAEAPGSAHEVKDADKARIVELARGATTHDGVRAAVGYVDADLGRSESFVNEVENQIHTLQEISRN
jgi:fructuronate reductase